MIPTSTIPEAHRVIQPHETKTPSISTSHPSGKSRVQRANLAKSTVTIRQMTNSLPPQHRLTLTAHPAIPGKKNRLNLHLHGYSEALATKTMLIIVEAIRHRREAVNLEQILVLATNISAGNNDNGGGSAKKSPSSPTSFSTFANFVSPNFGSKSKSNDKITSADDGIKAAEEGLDPYEDEDIDTNTHTHSPPNIDASTASSLLWEDMTLTSVSEEDAAAFRMKKGGGGVGGGRGFWGASGRLGGGSFGRNYFNSSGRDNIDDEVEQPSSSRFGRGGNLDGVRLRFEGSSQIDNGGGKFYRDSRGNLRLSDWDGFDNVVLTVTIFATKPVPSSGLSEGKQSTKSTVKKQRKSYPPTSGDVVVMELLSTKNPPTSESSMSPATNQSDQNRSHSRGDIASAAAAAAKWGKRDKNPNPPQINISSSSFSSSIPKSSKNPPLQSMGLNKSCGYTSGTSGTEDDSTSPPQHHPHQQLEYENSLTTEDEEKEFPSNHTRILARRVLRWPTSVLSRHGIANEQGDFNGDRPDFPMFVSLGRTNKWKKHKQEGDDDHRDRGHGSNISLRKRVPRGGGAWLKHFFKETSLTWRITRT